MTVEISQVAIWASIASPIIAVIIAVWSGISSRKATAKQLSAIKESTTKQVESIKKLAKIQIELNKIQLNAELWDADNKLEQKEQENEWAVDRQSSMFGVPLNEFTMRQAEEREKEDKNLAEQTYYMKKKLTLTTLVNSLKAVEIQLNKD